MSMELAPITEVISPTTSASVVQRLPKVPWRDPHSVSPEDLKGYIQMLEKAIVDSPQAVDLRTCLGMAHAMNFEVYKSMDALEAGMKIDPDDFWARFKYAELHYRLRTLAFAEEQTSAALNLAGNPWEMSLARRQLQEIRRLRRESARDVEWTKPLTSPVIAFAGMVALFVVAMVLR